MPAKRYNWEVIEGDVLRREQPFDYQQVAKEYDVPYKQLKNRGSKHNWRSRHNEFLRKVNREKDKRQIKEYGDSFSRVNRAIIKLTEALLALAQRKVKKAQDEGDEIKMLDLKHLADVLGKLQDIHKNSHGDTAIALNYMVQNNLIPLDYVPQIQSILEESDNQSMYRLGQVFKGDFKGELLLPD